MLDERLDLGLPDGWGGRCAKSPLTKARCLAVVGDFSQDLGLAGYNDRWRGLLDGIDEDGDVLIIRLACSEVNAAGVCTRAERSCRE